MIKLKTGHKIKTHEELKITFAEWGALIGLTVMLHDNMIPMHGDNNPAGAHVFNLETSCTENGHCGSVGCIGGYVGMTLGMDIRCASNYVHTNFRLRELYFPTTALDYDRVTPKEAAKAICNVLEYGEPMWHRVVTHDQRQRARYTPYKGKVLSHNKLNISFAEWLSLICVRVMLECGAVDHARDTANRIGALRFLREHEGVHAFNMGQPLEAANCGTVGCIGGYMGSMMFVSPRRASEYVMAHDPDYGDYKKKGLCDLFFPRINRSRCLVNYDKIDTKMAVQAIDNFLTTGKPNWEKVLAK